MHCAQPITYQIGTLPPGVSEADVEAEVARAFDAWAAVSCADLTFEYAGRVPASGRSAALLIEWPTTWTHEPTTWAVAAPTWTMGCIVGGVVECNARDFSWSVAGGAGDTELSVYRGVLRSIGNTLGMGSSSVPGSLMHISAPDVAVPQADDEEGICTLYPASALSVCDRCVRDESCGDADLGVDYPGGVSFCGRACTAGGSECASDEECADVGGGVLQCMRLIEGVRACRERPAGPCTPCTSGADCSGGVCLAYPSGAEFCGATCTLDEDCAGDEQCVAIAGGGACVRFVAGMPNCTDPAMDGGVDADAGARVDGGAALDGGVARDAAATMDAGGGAEASGCGCRAGAPSSGRAGWLLLALAALAWRRRREAPASKERARRGADHRRTESVSGATLSRRWARGEGAEQELGPAYE